MAVLNVQHETQSYSSIISINSVNLRRWWRTVLHQT